MILIVVLPGNQLTDSSAPYLVEALKNNSSLTTLDLSNNNFGEQAGVLIGGALVNTLNLLCLNAHTSSL